MKDFDHDIIVIGGGPTGATFSRIAAQAGLDVLVIDKRKEIGNPVRCGEALGVTEPAREGLEIPKYAIGTTIDGAKIIAPNGKAIVWKDERTRGYVLERKFFDKWLCELAVEKGATIKTYTRTIDIICDNGKENGKLCGVVVSHGGREPYELRAPLIVSAEGMESLMARKMGFKTVHSLYDVDTCYEYEMKPYDHEHLIELYYGNGIAPRGYVWIFPKDGKKANVGIGIGGLVANNEKLGGIKGADPKPLLDQFIKNHEKLKEASTLLDFGGVISVGAPLNEFVKDNVMIVGTAAKQVDPIHGGGIAIGMEAGVMAAKVAIKAHEKKDFSKQTLYEYEKLWRDTTGKVMQKRLILRKVMERFSDDDMNHIFNVVGENDLHSIMGAEYAGIVARVLAGRPQLLTTLGALA